MALERGQFVFLLKQISHGRVETLPGILKQLFNYLASEASANKVYQEYEKRIEDWSNWLADPTSLPMHWEMPSSTADAKSLSYALYWTIAETKGAVTHFPLLLFGKMGVEENIQDFNHTFFDYFARALDDIYEADPGRRQVPDPTSSEEVAVNVDPSWNRRVFVVSGRNKKINDSIFQFLRSVGIEPIEWGMAKSLTGKPLSYIGEIVDAAFKYAKAVIVLLTPDDEVRLRTELQLHDDPAIEKEFAMQPRPNVIFEAGAALASKREQTIIVECGTVKEFSDIAGLHLIRLDNSAKKRKELVDALARVGVLTDTYDKTDWFSVGDFTIV